MQDSPTPLRHANREGLLNHREAERRELHAEKIQALLIDWLIFQAFHMRVPTVSGSERQSFPSATSSGRRSVDTVGQIVHGGGLASLR